MPQTLVCADRHLSLDKIQVMGVLNVTPDSFSDGGCFNVLDAAVKHAERMVEAGASIVDVGGESTRPGAAKVSLQEELDRVCPVVERLIKEMDVVVSVDSSTPEVMRESIALGCHLLNDVRAFTRPGAVETVVDSNVALCVMHMQGEPDTMQRNPSYAQVMSEVYQYLGQRLNVLREAGVPNERLLVDPGFGFGKTLEHNLALLRDLDQLKGLATPILAGLSRKSMIGAILDKPVEQRLFGSVSAAVIAAMNGAKILRVHDVSETVDALKIVDALSGLD